MTTSHSPARAGHRTPECDDATGLGSSGGARDQDRGHRDCASAVNLRKRLATLQAELARRGYELKRTDSGALLIARWGLSRELRDVAAVEDFARQVGATQ